MRPQGLVKRQPSPAREPVAPRRPAEGRFRHPPVAAGWAGNKLSPPEKARRKTAFRCDGDGRPGRRWSACARRQTEPARARHAASSRGRRVAWPPPPGPPSAWEGQTPFRCGRRVRRHSRHHSHLGPPSPDRPQPRPPTTLLRAL